MTPQWFSTGERFGAYHGETRLDVMRSLVNISLFLGSKSTAAARMTALIPSVDISMAIKFLERDELFATAWEITEESMYFPCLCRYDGAFAIGLGACENTVLSPLSWLPLMMMIHFLLCHDRSSYGLQNFW